MQTVFGKLALLQRLECAEADMQADGFAFEARCIDFGQQAGVKWRPAVGAAALPGSRA